MRGVALLFAAFLALQSLSHAQAPPSGPRFEVASLKERERNGPVFTGVQRAPGRLFGQCTTLNSLVFYAYRLTWQTRIEGLPGWADTPCSETATTNTYEFQAAMPPDTTDADARLMLQTFLAERFKLAVHRETRTGPVYALVVAADGFKLKAMDPKDEPRRARGSLGCPADDRGCHVMALGVAPMSDVASALGANIGRPVIDKTGLRETYYVDMTWAGDAPNSSLPSLPALLKEKFGLELKSDTGAIETLVIDRAEKPLPN